MAHEVIMPALGMAQETGVLVAWLKAPGDTVAADEALMEVETDKTTMEVPAGSAGVVATLLAAEGTEVPVGQVVAIIAAPGETVAEPPAPAPAPAAPEPAPEPASAPAPGPAVAVAPKPAPPAPVAPVAAPATHSTGRVLASPKARRLAREQGIDLGRLVAAGVAQPIHVRDLDAAPASARLTGGPQRAVVTARCGSDAFDALLERLSGGDGVAFEPHLLVAGFCAAALRAVAPRDRLVVAVEVGPGGRRIAYADPDFYRPTRPHLAGEGEAPSLIMRDLTGSRITGVRLGSDPVPAVTLAGGAGRGGFDLELTFHEDELDLARAVGLVENLATRLESPLHFLA